jgi:hypothetical protein
MKKCARRRFQITKQITSSLFFTEIVSFYGKWDILMCQGAMKLGNSQFSLFLGSSIAPLLLSSSVGPSIRPHIALPQESSHLV